MTNNMTSKKIAVLSGANGYVGSAIAKRLASENISLALIHREQSKDTCMTLLQNIPGSGHMLFSCNLENPSEVKSVFSQIEKDMGPIFISIHAAGTMPKQKQLHLLTESEVKEQIEKDVLSAFNFLSESSLYTKKNKDGVIVAITTASVVTQVNTKSRGVYSLVKFALQGILTALREELSAHGVRVYSVAPGVMEGGLNKNTPNAFLDMTREKIPSKKLATSEDVAETVAFLCSENSKHLTNLTMLIAPESTTQ